MSVSPKLPLCTKNFTKIMEKLETLEKPVVWCNTGSLTNLCILMLTFPDVKQKISKIVMMGGAVEKGNIKIHRFVNEPVLHHTTGSSRASSFSMIFVKFLAQRGSLGETGNSTPPSPFDPCTCSARFILPLRIWRPWRSLSCGVILVR